MAKPLRLPLTLAFVLAGAMAIAGAAPSQPDAAVLVGAGDIAGCASLGDEATAAILDGVPGTVFTAGDNAYPSGTEAEFATCYHPSWGRHRARTRPSPGNHDYVTRGALPYFRYFGAAAGDPSRGYYSYDLNAWHVIALNSNCWAVGGCGPASPQVAWLQTDLAASRAICAVAYWHHPRFSSGPHGNQPEVDTLWRVLAAAGVDVAIAGHDHDYERFAPMDADGQRSTTRGMRSFVVGTGGFSHYTFREIAAHSELRHTGTFGVLKLTLQPGRYTWEFLPESGKTFRDAGSDACH